MIRWWALAVLGVSACGVPADPCPGLVSGGDREGTAVELEALRALRAQVGAPGVVLAVQVGDGLPWIGAAGCSSLNPVTPLQPEDRFLIGSVTKTFAGALLLQLHREGLLSLDEPLSQRLPELDGLNDATVRQAMNHTSGLYNVNEDPRFRERIASGEWTSQELSLDALNHAPYFAAGEGFHYSNTNYVLSGMVAERATGASLATLLRTRFFDPLGLAATTYIDGEPMGEVVDSYQLNCSLWVCDGHAEYPPEATATPWVGFAGGVAASARDTLRWTGSLVGGAVLTSEDQATMRGWVDTGFAPAPPEVKRYGIGWMDYGDGAEGHTGLMPGFHSILVHRPEQDLRVVAFVNEMGNGEAFIRQVLEAVVPALVAGVSP